MRTFFFLSLRCVCIRHIRCVRFFFNSFRCLYIRNIGCTTLSVVRASETLDVRIFFNSSQCLRIRIFGCVHWVKSLLDDGKQKASDRCVLCSCGLIIAQTETCKLSICIQLDDGKAVFATEPSAGFSERCCIHGRCKASFRANHLCFASSRSFSCLRTSRLTP